MTTNADDPRRITTDFLVWLEQNDPDGDAWFLDEGPVAAVPVPAEAQVEEPLPALEEPAAPELAVRAATEPAPAAPTAPAAGLDPADPFAEECRQFVERTLDSIRRQGARPEAEGSAVPAEQALAALRDRVTPCTACALHTGRTREATGSVCRRRSGGWPSVWPCRTRSAARDWSFWMLSGSTSRRPGEYESCCRTWASKVPRWW